MSVLGIDLGGACIHACLYGKGQKARPVVGRDGSADIPTMVSFEDPEEPRLGKAALHSAQVSPHAAVRNVKSFLGRKSQDPALGMVLKGSAVTVDLGSKEPVFVVAGHRFGARDVVRTLFEHVCENAKALSAGNVDAAIVALPANYDSDRSKALSQAAMASGFSSVRLIQEAVAAVAGTARLDAAKRLALVIDVGATTTSAAVVNVGGGTLPTLRAQWCEEIGGAQIDAKLVELAAEQLGRSDLDPASFEILRQTCEGIKQELSLGPEANAVVPYLPGGGGGMLTFDERQLEQALAPLLRTLERCCAKCCQEVGVRAQDISERYVIGGMVRAPAVLARLRRIFGSSVRINRDPTGAVARGAALLSPLLGFSAGGRSQKQAMMPPPSGATSDPHWHPTPVPPGGDTRKSSKPPPSRPSSPQSAMRAADFLDAARAAATAKKTGMPQPPPLTKPPTRPLAPAPEPAAEETIGPNDPTPGPEPADPPKIPEETVRQTSPPDMRAPSSVPIAPVTTAEAGFDVETTDRAQAHPVFDPEVTEKVPVPADFEPEHTEQDSAPEFEPEVTEPERELANLSPEKTEQRQAEPGEKKLTPPPSMPPGSWPPYGAGQWPPPQSGFTPPPGYPTPPPGPHTPPPQEYQHGQPPGYPPGYPPQGYYPPPGSPYPGYPPPPYPYGYPPPGGQPAPGQYSPVPGQYSPAPYPSTPPSRWSITPGQPSMAYEAPVPLEKGGISNPKTPVELLSIPVTGPLAPADLDPVALPVLLLRVLGQPSTVGTLTLKADQGGQAVVPVLNGRAMLSNNERTQLTNLFIVASGTYFFESSTPDGSKRRAHSMLSVVAEGLRALVRSFSVEDITACMGDLLHAAPFVNPINRNAVNRLTASDLESRLVENNFDGKRSIKDLVAQLGPVRRTAMQVLMMLKLFDLVEFRQPQVKKEEEPEEMLRKRAAQMAKGTHFDILGLHWSAIGPEVDKAYGDLQEELAKGGETDKLSPEVCQEMRKRVEDAYAVLCKEGSRAAYRREAYPSLDFAAVQDLLQKKAEALSLHEDHKPLREIKSAIRDMANTKRHKGTNKPG